MENVGSGRNPCLFNICSTYRPGKLIFYSGDGSVAAGRRQSATTPSPIHTYIYLFINIYIQQLPICSIYPAIKYELDTNPTLPILRCMHTCAQSHSTNPFNTSSIVVIFFFEFEASPLLIMASWVFGLAL